MSKAKQTERPTHRLKVVVDQYPDPENEDHTIDVTEEIGVAWKKENYMTGKVTRNRVLLKGERLLIFTIDND